MRINDYDDYTMSSNNGIHYNNVVFHATKPNNVESYSNGINHVNDDRKPKNIEKAILIGTIAVLTVIIGFFVFAYFVNISDFMTNMYAGFIDFWIENTANKNIQSAFMGFLTSVVGFVIYCMYEDCYNMSNYVLKIIVAVMIMVLLLILTSVFGLWSWMFALGIILSLPITAIFIMIVSVIFDVF